MKLAEKIRILRKKEGLSQEDLGNKISNGKKDYVSRQAVSDWETEKTRPNTEKIIQLAKIFNVSTDYLLNDELEVYVSPVSLPEVIKEESIRDEVNNTSISDKENNYYHQAPYDFKFEFRARGPAIEMPFYIKFALKIPLIIFIISDISILYNMGGGGWWVLMLMTIFYLMWRFFHAIVLAPKLYMNYGPPEVIIGELTNTHLTISRGPLKQSSIAIKTENIEYLSLVPPSIGDRQSIAIHTIESEEPLVIKYVYNANNVVQTFNSAFKKHKLL